MIRNEMEITVKGGYFTLVFEISKLNCINYELVDKSNFLKLFQ